MVHINSVPSFYNKLPRVTKPDSFYCSVTPGTENRLTPLSGTAFTLLCPVSKTRQSFPVRTQACQHVETVDLKSMMESLPSTASTKENLTASTIFCCPLCSQISTLYVDEVIDNILGTTKFNNCTAVIVHLKFEPFIFAEPEQDLEFTEHHYKAEKALDRIEETDESEKCKENCKEDCHSGHENEAVTESSRNGNVEGEELAPTGTPDEVTEHIVTETDDLATGDDVDPIQDLPEVYPGCIVGSSETDNTKSTGGTGNGHQEDVPAKVELDPKRKKDVCVVA